MSSRRPLPAKNLLNMPHAVRASAWGHDDNAGWVAALMREIDPVLDWLLKVLTAICVVGAGMISLATVLSLITGGTIKDTSGVGIFQVLFGFACLFCAASHAFKLMLFTPRADPEFPILDDMEHWTRSTRLIAASAVAVAAILWIWAWAIVPTHKLKVAWQALLMTFPAVGLAFYAVRPPMWGRRVASAVEWHTWNSHSFKSSADLSREEDYATPVTPEWPREGFAGIEGMEDTKARVLKAAREIQSRAGVSEAPRNGILLHGEPGNGKTIFVEALAGELQVPLVRVTYGAVTSKWKGETPKLVSRCFSVAKANAPCVLFIDEIDSLIQSRDASTHAEDIKVTNTLLTELVSVREHAVIVVAATNFLASLDAAAIREGRFDFKIEVPPPDMAAREGILRASAAKFAGHLRPDAQVITRVADRWEGFSVSRLVAIAKALPEVAPERGPLGFEQWMAALRKVQGGAGQRNHAPRKIEELILAPATRDALSLLAARMLALETSEKLGATLPRGVLFYGPPGTGKTVAAQALTEAAGWAWLVASGAEMANDHEKLPELVRKAADLRPCVLFIDEADDLLRSRAFGQRAESLNRLLTLLDGAGTPLRDVMLIAATNHPDQVDPALLRAGRFTEKLLFEPPDRQGLRLAAERWLATRPVEVEAALIVDLVEKMEGHSVAMLEGVLQYALNRAALSTAAAQGRTRITEMDLRHALEVVAVWQEADAS